jgi:serine phosphatase RsbU (regulator of sigma subunit)
VPDRADGANELDPREVARTADLAGRKLELSRGGKAECGGVPRPLSSARTRTSPEAAKGSRYGAVARAVHRFRLVYFSNTVVQAIPDGPRWKLGAFQLLAESGFGGGPVGGDFYAFELRDAKRLAIVIGDACGRGTDGAELLPNIVPRLEALARSFARPSRLLEELNRRIILEMPSDRFVTGAAFDFDAQSGILTVANAGHVPAILRDARGNVRVIGQASGPPLGVFGNCNYTDQHYRIGKGDVVVFMTDGILEVVENDLAEMPRLKALVAEAPAGSRGVHRFLMDYVKGRSRERRADDMTLLSLEVLCSGRDLPGSIDRERMV